MSPSVRTTFVGSLASRLCVGTVTPAEGVTDSEPATYAVPGGSRSLRTTSLVTPSGTVRVIVVRIRSPMTASPAAFDPETIDVVTLLVSVGESIVSDSVSLSAAYDGVLDASRSPGSAAVRPSVGVPASRLDHWTRPALAIVSPASTSSPAANGADFSDPATVTVIAVSVVRRSSPVTVSVWPDLATDPVPSPPATVTVAPARSNSSGSVSVKIRSNASASDPAAWPMVNV